MNAEMNIYPSQSPVVSVLMIAYNNESCISEAIAGVVKQRVDFGVELIIMDDCSTDSTPDIIRDWHERYPDIIKPVRNERNLGIQRNYMAGFRLCSGRYVAMCDADDYWCSRRKLARQVHYMENHPECNVCFHRMINYYEGSGEKSFSNGMFHGNTDLTPVDLSRTNYITNASVMYRRARVDLHALPDWLAEIRLMDYAMHMLYADGGYIHFFSRPMAVYRQSAGAAWSLTDAFDKRVMAIDVRLKLIDHFRQARPELVGGLRDAVAAMLRSMATGRLDDRQRKYVDETASKLGLVISYNPRPDVAQPSAGRPLLKRMRAWVSRFIPLPRP